LLRAARERWFNPLVTHEAAQALQWALNAVVRDPSQRARALSALRGIEVLAVSWPTDPATLRTLTNSEGVTALPVFSSEQQLEDAAARYGWLSPDGRIPSRRLHIWEAVRFARLHHAQLLVIDIVADHALSLDEGEMELMSAPPSGRPPSYAGLGNVRSSRPPHDGREVARISTRPPAPSSTAPFSDATGVRAALRSSQSALKPTSVTPNPDGHTLSATFGAAPTLTMEALDAPPSDEVLDTLTQVLREYPEVEWACLVRAQRAGAALVPSIALRIEPAFRKHLSEISARLHQSSAELGFTLEVLMLDTPEQMRLARSLGLPFYPWRKR
jgi:hypothetical protein